MRGPSLVEWHLVKRGLFSWVLTRSAFALALLLTKSHPLANGGLVGLGVIALATALGMVEVQRAHERVLLANLGVALPLILALLAAGPVLAEIAFAALIP